MKEWVFLCLKLYEFYDCCRVRKILFLLDTNNHLAENRKDHPAKGTPHHFTVASGIPVNNLNGEGQVESGVNKLEEDRK